MRSGGEEQFSTPEPPLPSDMPGRRAREGQAPQFHRRPEGERGPEFRQEQRSRLEHAQGLAQRLLDDPSTPDEIKAKARRLVELLSKREGLVRDLDSKRQSFIQEHGQDLEELRQLRERGEVVRQRLRAGREKVISDNLPAIKEMHRTTQEARDVAGDLRGYYRQRWRNQERPASPGQE
jgi:hypothetical protein